MHSTIRRIFVVSLVLVAITAFAATSFAGTCNLKRVTVTTSVFTGEPTIPCQAGVNVVEVTLSISGPGGGSVTDLRCGDDDAPLSISYLGRTYIIGPSSGYDWADVLGGNCAALQTTLQ